MVLTEFLEIEVNQGNCGTIRRFSSDVEIGDIVKIPPLTFKGSERDITVKCYYCNIVRRVTVKNYISSTKKYEKYCCNNKNCMSRKRRDMVELGINKPLEKRVKTNLERYGVESTFQLKSVQKRIKDTLLDRYGVIHPSHNKEIIGKSVATRKKRYPKKYGKIKGIRRVKKAVGPIAWVKNKPKTYREFFVDLRTPNQKRIDTNMKRYGVPHVSQVKSFRKAAESTNLERYGSKNPFGSKAIQGKIKEVMINRYGVDHNFKCPKIRNRRDETILKKYGVTNVSKNEEIKKRVRDTNRRRYGVSHISQSEEFRRDNYEISNEFGYIRYSPDEGLNYFKCDEGHEFGITADRYYSRKNLGTPLCTVCNPISSSSSFKEREFYDFVCRSTPHEVLSNYRDVLELDVYIPELKLGFEFNGLFWHSEEFKENDYHLSKTRHFKEKGIRVVHIWEDEWDFKRDVVESQILHMIGKSKRIYGRNTEVKEVDKREARKFLDENHLQGSYNRIIKSYGLYKKGELVSLMTFDNLEGRDIMPRGNWNLSRFCNKKGVSVVGGASKLLKYFKIKEQPEAIITYADRDWSEGELYDKLGFKKEYETRADYKYVVSGKRVHKSRYRRKKGALKTEREYMLGLGIRRIYDCGKIKYRYTKK